MLGLLQGYGDNETICWQGRASEDCLHGLGHGRLDVGGNGIGIIHIGLFKEMN